MKNFQKMLIQSENISPKSSCAECAGKICCAVFDVIYQKNQGRNNEIVKKWWEPCPYLDKNWMCGVVMGKIRPSMWKACDIYTCNNVWPMLSFWLEHNNIDIMENSLEIGMILQLFKHFLENDGKNFYAEKYNFLYKILEENNSLKGILSKYQKSQEIYQNFYKEKNHK